VRGKLVRQSMVVPQILADVCVAAMPEAEEHTGGSGSRYDRTSGEREYVGSLERLEDGESDSSTLGDSRAVGSGGESRDSRRKCVDRGRAASDEGSG